MYVKFGKLVEAYRFFSPHYAERDVAADFLDAGLDLQELETPGVDLGRDQLRAREVMTQQPQLVGQEAMTIQAAGLEFPFQFRDVVSRLAPDPREAGLDKPRLRLRLVNTRR
jgi:hypothetical protein